MQPENMPESFYAKEGKAAALLAGLPVSILVGKIKETPEC